MTVERGATMSYQLYRNTDVGSALQESLDELIQYGNITPGFALKVLLQFDKSIQNALKLRAEKLAGSKSTEPTHTLPT